MAATGIGWTDLVWNVVTGCDRISRGCDNCYALTFAARLKRMGNDKYQSDGNAITSGPGFGLTLHPDLLDWPTTITTPKRIFINSMSDLWHGKVPLSFIRDVFDVVRATPHLTYIALTKRSLRLARFADKLDWPDNLWVGVSIEAPEYAYRADHLRRVPAAVRWISAEPLYEPLAADRLNLDGIGWLVVGGESGLRAKPMHPDWARELRDRAVAEHIPLYFKQWGAWVPLDSMPPGTPADIKGRTMPVESGRPGVEAQPVVMRKVGSRRAGNVLDRRIWENYPPAPAGVAAWAEAEHRAGRPAARVAGTPRLVTA